MAYDEIEKIAQMFLVMSNDLSSPSKSSCFVKAAAIAKHYATTPATIYKWAKEGKIPSVAFQGTIRFDFDKVRTAIEGGRP